MVSITTNIKACITLFFTLILTVIVYVIYGVKNKGKGVWTAWLLGAAGFFVSQIIIRMPILSVVSLLPGVVSFEVEHYVWYCLILAFTAGLFEAAGRYAVAKILSKKLDYTRSFAAGLGHGSIEAMFVVGITYVNNLLYIIMINTGIFDSIVAQTAVGGMDTTMLLALKESLINTPSGIFLLAGYERILTVLFHIALSMVVCYFMSRKKDVTGILICILCHWAVDFIVAVMNGMATVYLGNAI
ncbi:MAG: YhfC family intramembrane metalloprotease, partial [Lachnospiraceae bacterium]|nr:YhfC family intramembrane metalloprotease [Lachnospiraceae bacterium]